MPHRALAVWAIRGVSFSAVGPGASAPSNCIPPTASRGRIAMPSTMMPMPPSHWVSERQSSSAAGSASTFCSTEAPVVVNPDADSNRASTAKPGPLIKT